MKNIHKRPEQNLIVLLNWTSWHFIDFCLLLIPPGASCGIIALSHSFALFLCPTYAHTHSKLFTILASQKLLSFLTLRGTLKCTVMASLLVALKQMADAYKSSRCGTHPLCICTASAQQGPPDKVDILENIWGTFFKCYDVVTVYVRMWLSMHII